MVLTRLAGAALVVFVACGSSSDGTDEGDGTTDSGATTGNVTSAAADDTSMEATVDLPGVHFGYDVWPILRANCSCHTVMPAEMTPGAQADPFMGEDPGGAYLVLVDKPSQFTGLDYVEPGDSAASYLFHKVSGTQMSVGGDGSAMPPGLMLTADQLATIQAWIDMGALE